MEEKTIIWTVIWGGIVGFFTIVGISWGIGKDVKKAYDKKIEGCSDQLTKDIDDLEDTVEKNRREILVIQKNHATIVWERLDKVKNGAKAEYLRKGDFEIHNSYKEKDTARIEVMLKDLTKMVNKLLTKEAKS
ncbi:MAG: hypothetical protein KAQ99_08665 [Candidatus Aureabacteria bacterium]|nr:hypothetical protein [Candidatus Auribacterota bacterium]MCK5590615.1 hypothetical protein [Candidatus Paceibacterota bacterium]